MATNYRFPMVRNLPNCEGKRKVSIVVYESECMSIAPVPGFRIVMGFETWTGVRWLSIVQDDEAFTIEDAIQIARNMRASLGL